MKLPIYTFWELHKQISSIAAEETLRMIEAVSVVMNPKADVIINKLAEDAKGLVEVEHIHGFDRKRVDALKARMGFK